MRIAALGVIAGVLLLSCGGAAKPVIYTRDGESLRPLDNGSPVRLDGASAEVHVAPYPPAGRTELDIVVREPRTGAALQSDVRLLAWMSGMDHAPALLLARPDGAHHRAAVDLGMGGRWVITVNVTRPGRVETFDLVLEARGK